MSRSSAHVLLGALAALWAAGCAGPGSLGDYFENRRHDLIDVAHVDFSFVNAGAVAYVCPLMVGWNCHTDVRTPGKDSATLQVGLGGARSLGREGIAAGLLWPSSRWNPGREIYGPRPKQTPSGSSVGVSVGALFGISVEADLLELIDFLGGIANLDLMEDDPCVAAEEPPDEPGDSATAGRPAAPAPPPAR